MSAELVKQVEQKAEEIEELANRFQTLVERLKEDKKNAPISLPEFEAYGWERVEEFLGRLEDALNFPLLERARTTLEKAGFNIDQLLLDKIKSALPQKRGTLPTTFETVSTNLNKIKNLKVRASAKEDIANLLSKGNWDGLVEKTQKWKELEKSLEPLTNEMSNNTHLYNSLFNKVLQEGPYSDLIKGLSEIQNKALIIDDLLKEKLPFQRPRDENNPLRSVDEDLDIIVRKKENIRNLSGNEVNLSKYVGKDVSYASVIKRLDTESFKIKEMLNKKQQRCEELLSKRNMLAHLLKKGDHTMPLSVSLKILEDLNQHLGEEIKEMQEELEKSLSEDARRLIDLFFEGSLPEDWNPERLLRALREILSRGYTFEAKWKE